MVRPSELVVTSAVLSVVAAGPAWAQTPVARRVSMAASVVARATSTPGSIRGVVMDERGRPLAGAVVSAMGAATAVAESDSAGRFLLAELEPDAYVVRAHLLGFARSERMVLNVEPGSPVVSSLVLRRLGRRLAGTVGTGGLLGGPLAGSDESALVQPDGAGPVSADPERDTDGEADELPGLSDHSHEELAWRLRHLKRTVLREATAGVSVADAAGEGMASRAAAGYAASAFLGDQPLSGEFNFLTVSSFDDPGDLFAADGLPRGVTYVSLGAPTGEDGRWAVKGAMTQGDLSSWFVGGSYSNEFNAAHRVDLAMSYAMQRYSGGNPAALAAVTDGSRNVGSLSALDRWAVSDVTTVTYGARYARHDYLDRPHLVSPRLGIERAITKRTRVLGSLSQHMTAPGAEEFLPPPMEGIWLPPERTFSPLTDGSTLRPERTRHAEMGIIHDVALGYAIGLRRFRQSVSDQAATLFDVRVGGESVPNLGHYYVATPGSVNVDGWGVSLTADVSSRIRGSVDYAVARAQWGASPQTAGIALSAASAARTGEERYHDVTTSVETDIPETRTRLYVFYRLNSAFALAESEAATPGFDSRFDVRVHQGLPFLAFTNVDWELLFAVRNLFHEPLGNASAYDELLTVRPPKRIVGGLMVRF